MQENLEFLCQYEDHDEDEILGFCLNQKCTQNVQFCLKCCGEKHGDHEEDCKTFKQIQKLFFNNKKIEEQQNIELNNKIKDIKQLCDQISQNKNADSERLKQLEKNLKEEKYDKCLESIPLFKQYCHYLETNSYQFKLEQLDKLGQTLKILTQGYSEIVKQRSFKQESQIKNENQLPLQSIQLKVQKKDQEIQVNIEIAQKQQQHQDIHEIRRAVEIKELKPVVPQKIGQDQGSNPQLLIKPPSDQLPPQSNPMNQQKKPQASSQNQISQARNPPSAQNLMDQIPKAHPLQGSLSSQSKNISREIQRDPDQQNKQKLQQQLLSFLEDENQISQKQIPLKQLLEIAFQQKLDENHKNKKESAPKLDLDPDIFKFQESELINAILVFQCENLIEKGDNLEALQVCNKAIEKDPNDCILHILKCKILINLKQLEEALTLCNSIIEKDPNQKKIYVLKGVTLHLLKRFEESLKYFDLSIQLEPNEFAGHFHKGNTFLLLKQYQKAIQCYERSIDIDPVNESGYLQMGVALMKLNQLDQAIESFDTVININPKSQEALIFKSLCLNELHIYQEAIKISDTVLELNPDNPKAYFSKGQGLLKAEDYNEALVCLDKAIQIDDQFHEAYFLKGEALHNLKKFSEAIQSYDLAIKISPEMNYIQKKNLSLKSMEKNEDANGLQVQVNQLENENNSSFKNHKQQRF